MLHGLLTCVAYSLMFIITGSAMQGSTTRHVCVCVCGVNWPVLSKYTLHGEKQDPL